MSADVSRSGGRLLLACVYAGPAALRAGYRLLRDFWCRPVRAEPLALFRIAVGLTALGALLTGVGPRLTELAGLDGLCPARAIDDWLGRSGRMCLLRGPVNVPLLGDWLPADLAADYPWLNAWVVPENVDAWKRSGETLQSTQVLFAAYLLALACMTLGLFTRTATVVALLMANTFFCRFSDLMNGGDDLVRNALYFLVFSPAGAVWSLDRAWRMHRLARLARALGLPPPDAAAPVIVAPWSIRLMQIQLCAMYLFSGLCKADPNAVAELVVGLFRGNSNVLTELGGRLDWLDGQAMYWILNDVSLCRWPYAWLPVPLAVCRLLSWGTLAFEIGFTFLVPFRRLRPWLLVAGVALHAGIFAAMEIGWFSQISLCWYALFLPGETIARFFRRFGRR
jgi:hypothetical protein